jgi:hypothetical protein
VDGTGVGVFFGYQKAKDMVDDLLLSTGNGKMIEIYCEKTSKQGEITSLRVLQIAMSK